MPDSKLERYFYEWHIDVDKTNKAYITKPGPPDSDLYLFIGNNMLFEIEFAKDLCTVLNTGRRQRIYEEGFKGFSCSNKEVLY